MSEQNSEGLAALKQFAESQEALVSALGAELMTVDESLADLPTLVEIIERFGTLKTAAREAGDLPSYRVAHAYEEIISGMLCERYPEPESILENLRDAMNPLGNYLESLKASEPQPDLLADAVDMLYTILDVSPVEMPGTGAFKIFKEESVATDASEPEGDLPAMESSAPAEPEAPAPEPVAAPAPAPAPPAAAPTVALEGETASNGLPESFDDPEIYSEFVLECNEHLETIEEKILSLEDSPEDTDLINEIFRPIHSMKGGAGFLALTGLQTLAHDTETLLDRCRKHQISVSPEIIETCLQSVDCIKQMISNLNTACESGSVDHPEIEAIEFGGVRAAIHQLLGDGAPQTQPADAPAPAVAPAAPAAPAAPEPPAAGAEELPPEAIEAAKIILEAEKAREQGEKEPEILPEMLGDLEDENFASRCLPRGELAPEDLELNRRYVQQCQEHLEHMEEQILDLEAHPEDAELINGIFRAMHSIKGDSGFMEQRAIGETAHSCETLLGKVREKQVPVGPRFVDIALRAVDQLKQMVGNLEAYLNAPKTPREDFKPIPYRIICSELKSYIENPTEELEDAPPKLGELLVRTGAITEEQLQKALELQQCAIGEVLVQTGAVDQSKVDLALKRQQSAMGSTGQGDTGARSIKVDTAKIDKLVNLVGELVITEAQVAQMVRGHSVNGNGSDRVMERNLSQLGKITKELQDGSMSLRMMPIRQTFQKMNRLVRDASKKIGKQVRLDVTGENVELDKTVVEQIGDPLVHMIRNCVDHGIEPAEERLAAGKPESGLINLDAYYEGDRIMIRVVDDGRGLDRDRILEKAIANGIVSAEANLTDSQIYELIFAAGLSTAKQVTDISGRGVGMDVVKRNIEKLRGQIIVDSTKGKGTSITISLPLTLAIIDGMVVRVGPEEYIIPTASIQESLQPGAQDLSTVTGKGETVNFRGRILSLVRLHRLWNIPAKYDKATEALLVIVENKGRQICLMVDELVGQQQIVIKNLGDHFAHVRGITGATIMGNGRVGLILDIDGLIERATA